MNAALSLLLFLYTQVGNPAAPEDVPASESPTVDTITLEIDDVFDLSDPRENSVFYRLADRLHRNTRPSVIRRQLLFHPGETFDPQLLAESERLLRQSTYLSDAEIVSLPVVDHRVDVVVRTRDTWSFKGGVNFGRGGGANHSSLELTDSNLLGLGKKIVLKKTFGIDRDSLLTRYEDPNLLGSRSRLSVVFSDNSDGENWRFALGLPFFALDSRRALGLAASSDRRVVPLYRRGLVVDRFFQESRHFEVFRGFSRGLVGDRTHRWTLGLTFEEERFSSAPASELAATEPTVVLTNRTLAYPWIGFERVGSTFLKERNIDLIGRTEDRLLGTSFKARLGVSPEALSDDRSRVVFETQLRHILAPSDDSLVELTTDVSGRWASDDFENVRWTGEARYYHRVWDRHRFFARLGLAADYRRDSERQLLLGGDSGLRGYPLRFQDGDRQFLLTLEQRFFTPWSLFRLADIGAAAFFDMGRSWTPGAPSDDGSGVLKDVGLGLRLGLNRSSTGSVVHLDLAFPLDEAGGDLKRVQWLVSSRQSF